MKLLCRMRTTYSVWLTNHCWVNASLTALRTACDIFRKSCHRHPMNIFGVTANASFHQWAIGCHLIYSYQNILTNMVISATLPSPTSAIQKYQNPGFKKYIYCQNTVQHKIILPDPNVIRSQKSPCHCTSGFD